MVRLQGEGGPIGFPSPWSRTTRPSAIRTRRAPRAWPPARTPQSRARLARAPVPHCDETITVAFVGFHNHAAPSGEEAQASRPPLAATQARDAPIRTRGPTTSKPFGARHPPTPSPLRRHDHHHIIIIVIIIVIIIGIIIISSSSLSSSNHHHRHHHHIIIIVIFRISLTHLK